MKMEGAQQPNNSIWIGLPLGTFSQAWSFGLLLGAMAFLGDNTFVLLMTWGVTQWIALRGLIPGRCVDVLLSLACAAIVITGHLVKI